MPGKELGRYWRTWRGTPNFLARVFNLYFFRNRKMLKLVVFRYVDDFFGCERFAAYFGCAGLCFAGDRHETLEHALGCFARLMRLLMGDGVLAQHKMQCGPCLTLLGVDISLSSRGYSCQPSVPKVRKWLMVIRGALQTGNLSAGEASKLAGRLQWACQHMFRKIGRAVLRPIYNQCKSRTGKISEELRQSLCWWEDILAEGVCENFSWYRPSGQVVHMFCDAAGDPQRVAAILWVDGDVLFSDCPPPLEITQLWQERRDQQIMGLELLSIALGLSVFEKEIAGRKLVIHSDNTGAECCTRRGSARAFDHCSLIHQMWTHIAALGVFAWITRVPTDDNFADLPSRQSYDLLNAVGAEWREPRWLGMYLDAKAWATVTNTIVGTPK